MRAVGFTLVADRRLLEVFGKAAWDPEELVRVCELWLNDGTPLVERRDGAPLRKAFFVEVDPVEAPLGPRGDRCKTARIVRVLC